MTDEELRTTIRESVKQAIAECPPSCPIFAVDMGYWVQYMKTIGDGDFDKAVERVRKNHEYVKGLRSWQTKIGGWALNVLVVSVVGAVIGAIYCGLTGKQFPFK